MNTLTRRGFMAAAAAGEAAPRMPHCHRMPHLAGGMTTAFAVSA